MNDSTNTKAGCVTYASGQPVHADDSLSITIMPAVRNYLAAGAVLEACFVNPVTGCSVTFEMIPKRSSVRLHTSAPGRSGE